MTKSIHYLLILFACLFPFNTTTNNMLPPIIFMLWIIEGNLQVKWNILKTQKIFWLFISLIIILFLSLFWSDSIHNGYWPKRYDNAYEFWARKYLLQFLIFPVLLTIVNKKLFKNMISAFLLGMLISEIISYGIFFEFWSIGKATAINPSPFIHHIYYSIFLVFTIFILLIRFKRENLLILKGAYLTFAITALINLFINAGRSGQLAFVILFLYFIISFFKISKKNILITLSTLAFVITTAYNFSPTFKQRMDYTNNSIKEIQNGDYNSSFGQRIAVWIIIADILKEYPLMGVGLGDVKQKIQEIQEKKYPERAYITELTHTHNQFLQTYLEGGIIAFALLIWMFFMFFYINFYEFDGYVKVFAISLLILFLIDTPLHRNIGLLYVWLFTGMFFGYKRAYIEQNLTKNSGL